MSSFTDNVFAAEKVYAYVKFDHSRKTQGWRRVPRTWNAVPIRGSRTNWVAALLQKGYIWIKFTALTTEEWGARGEAMEIAVPNMREGDCRSGLAGHLGTPVYSCVEMDVLYS